MQGNQLLSFGFYRLTPERGQLCRGKPEVKLTPKTMAVLRHLVQQPGQVETKGELFRAVWPGTVVSDATLTACIKELRQALRDDARHPRYIETVHRRGYRFIGAVWSPESEVRSYKSKPAPSTQHPAPTFVGREAELEQLHSWLQKAPSGERQIVFVTGEVGIGKTTVVEAFVASLNAKNNLWIGRGQCVEHYGPGEAYLPVLEALGRLAREPEGQHLIELLSQH